ncbi:MAG: pitrilysin family protein [Verrucomicrobiae bacterium]|nr:pitrilysin family protein [Verrucomicrobiae bacterium]
MQKKNNAVPKQKMKNEGQSLSIADGFQKVVLENGMVLLLREDHCAPVVSVQVFVRTGSIHEDRFMGAGLSHILEHMLFKGTEKRGIGQIAREVEACGGSVNAYTSWDRTVFHIDAPADGGRPGTSHGTETAIDILADAIMHSSLPPDEYAREQQVILREMAMGRDNPDRQASEQLFSTAYQVHPCRHPVIGYEEIYRALKREDVLAYYRGRYVPNNLIWVVVGDIDRDKVRKQVEDLMGKWPRRSLPPLCIPSEPPQIGGRELAEESRTAAEQARLYVAFQTCNFRHADAAPLEMLAVVAGGGLSSRLYQELREKRQLVHEVDAWSHTPDWMGLFGVSAVADPGKVDASRKAILSELEKFKQHRVEAGELAKARKMLLSSHLGTLKTMSGQAGQLGGDELTAGDPDFSAQYLKLLQQVSAEDVQRVARFYLTPGRMTSTVLLPKGMKQKKEKAAAGAGDQAVCRKQLPNGLKWLVKEDHRLPFVELRLVMKSGLLFEKAENNGISQLTAKLLLKGTRNRSAEKIVSDIESVGGSISTYSGANSMGISIEVMKTDLPLAMAVMADILENSSFAEDMIAREKMAQLAEIRQEREQPVKIAMLNARARLFGAHPYSLPNLGTEKTIKALRRDDLLSFWRKVVVPSNMVLAVFGDVRMEEVERRIKADFGGLKDCPIRLPELPAPPFGRADRVVDKQDKEQGVVVIAYPGIDLKNPDRPALEVMNASLSGMGSRLFVRLRDQKALCYYVGCNEMIGLDRGFIYFYIGTEPSKAARAEEEILGEIDRLRKEGITAEELDRARNGLLGDRKMQKQNLGELALMSALDELYGLGYDYADRLEAAYGAVTIAQVQAAAGKYLGQKAVVSIVKP